MIVAKPDVNNVKVKNLGSALVYSGFHPFFAILSLAKPAIYNSCPFHVFHMWETTLYKLV